MITLHHARETRSFRILWFLEELQERYNFQYRIERAEFTPPSSGFFTQRTPSGKIPFLSDGNNNLSESGAIIQYLLDRYDTKNYFSPTIASDNRAAFLQWFHYAEGTLSTPLSTLLWHVVYKNDAEQVPSVIADAKDRAERSLAVVEKVFADNAYLVGNTFSAADAMVGFTLWSAKHLDVLDEKFSKLERYLQRLESRPALQRALELQ